MDGHVTGWNGCGRIGVAVVLLAGVFSQAMAEQVDGDASVTEAVAAAYAASDGAGTIRIRAEGEASGPHVRLRDVAALSGEGAEALGELVVGSFADGQDAVTIRAAQVRRALAGVRVNWARLNMAGHGACEVERRGAASRGGNSRERRPAANADEAAPPRPVEAPRTVRQQIERILIAMADFESEQMLIRYQDDDAALLSQPLAGGGYQIEPVSRGLPGRVVFHIRRDRPGERSQLRQVTVEVARRVVVVVLASAVMRGQQLSEADVEIKRMVLTSAVGEPVKRLEDAVGQTVVSSLRRGAVLYESRLRPPLLVHRHDEVVVESMAGGVSVIVRGRALSEGRLGERIRIRRHGSNDVLTAVVTGERYAVIRDAHRFKQRSRAIQGVQ